MESEKIKIVIIEDEFVIAEDMRTRLEEHGYEVSAVFDRGELALLFVSAKNADILLVDINLQGPMDGVELVKQLQAKMEIPIVYAKATFECARSTRPHAFLVKPFTPANLIASVDLAL